MMDSVIINFEFLTLDIWDIVPGDFVNNSDGLICCYRRFPEVHSHNLAIFVFQWEHQAAFTKGGVACICLFDQPILQSTFDQVFVFPLVKRSGIIANLDPFLCGRGLYQISTL
jgi:hypothetical protein